MKLYYEILRANITPEVLGKLKKNKIILESTSQKQIKGRYSIVAFSYGSVVLNNDLLKIKQKQNVEITEKSYEYLKIISINLIFRLQMKIKTFTICIWLYWYV